MASEDVVEVLRKVFTTPKPWVLFKHHSVVVIEEPDSNKSLADQAVDIIESEGPVVAGCERGDFNVITLNDDLGWVVTCHCPVLYSYVSPEEMSGDNANDMLIGLRGRQKRDDDSHNPEVIHEESKEEVVSKA